MSTPEEPEIRIGRYVLKRPLGAGAFGSVILGWQDNATGEPMPVVVKSLLAEHRRSESAVQRALREASLTMLVSGHPNIVEIRDVGIHEGRPYWVLEYIDGSDLGDLLQMARERRCGFSLAAAFVIIADIASALRHAHSGATIDGKPVQVVHRDVKPANLLVTRDGVVKLTDFGIGTTMEDGTLSGHLLGTPRYMSPEHVRGEVRPEMDIYSLGVIAWMVLENRVYRAECEGQQEHAARIMDGDIPPMYDTRVPPKLADLVKWCLHPVADHRPTADEVLKVLRQCPGFTRDPEVLKLEVEEFLGTRRSSGKTTAQPAAKPNPFAAFDQPLRPASRAALDDHSDPTPTPPYVDPDALTLVRERGDAERGRVAEHGHGLDVVDHVGEQGSDPTLLVTRVPPANAPTPTVARPSGTNTLPLATRTASSRPALRRSATIGVAIVVVGFVALVAMWGTSRSAAETAAAEYDEDDPPASVPAAQHGIPARHAPTPPKRADAVKRSAAAEPLSLPTIHNKSPSEARGPAPSPVIPEAATEPTAPPTDAPTASPAEPTATAQTPAERPKPRPASVPVAVVLDFLGEASIKIAGRSAHLNNGRADFRVPAGTHRVRWRRPDDTTWRDGGRHAFRAGNSYFIRLNTSGPRVVDLGAKP